MSVDLAEEENPAGVVIDERARGVLEVTSRFGDGRGLGNLYTRDDL